MKGSTKGCGPRGANSAPSQRSLVDTPAPDEGDGVNTSPIVGDRIAKTTCYMCAGRCGIDVHIQDGTIRYIAGNKDHPVNRGVLCSKGSAGIMQHYSPARLRQKVDTALVRARDGFESMPPDYGWGEFLIGGLQICEVAADHFTVVEKGPVSEVAMQLQRRGTATLKKLRRDLAGAVA